MELLFKIQQYLVKKFEYYLCDAGYAGFMTHIRINNFMRIKSPSLQGNTDAKKCSYLCKPFV